MTKIIAQMTPIEKIKAGCVDEADLLEFITDNDLLVAIAAASSPLATAPILDIASHDQDYQIRLAALNNEHLSQDTLLFLCNDPEPLIAQQAKELVKRRNL